jgi:hypothetical protein
MSLLLIPILAEIFKYVVVKNTHVLIKTYGYFFASKSDILSFNQALVVLAKV